MNLAVKLLNARIVPIAIASAIGVYSCHSPAKNEDTSSKIKRAVSTTLHTLPTVYEVMHNISLTQLQKKLAISTIIFLPSLLSSTSYKKHVWVDRALRIANLGFTISCFYFYYSLPFNKPLDFFLNLSFFSLQFATFIRSLHQKYNSSGHSSPPASKQHYV